MHPAVSYLPYILWGIAALVLWGWIGSVQVIHPSRYLPAVTPGDYGLPWQPVKFRTSDNEQIAAWFIPKEQPRGTLLLLHGFGTGKADMLDLAHAFHHASPYNLLVLDFRGHGESSGSRVSFGLSEIYDVEAAINFVSQQPGLHGLPVGCLGISMGGAIGLLSAARLPHLKAVVSDSTYSDLGRAIARAVRLSYHIPRVPLGAIVVWATEVRLKLRIQRLSPAEAIAGITPRPVFIIHGTHDRTIPYRDGELLFETAKEPKKLWLVEGAEHVGSFYLRKEEYLKRVLEFLDDGFR